MIACALFKEVRRFVTWVTYTMLLKKRSRCGGGGVVSGFRWDPSYKQVYVR
jgi:hypothetical protein